MKVLYINNDGGGFADYLVIEDGTTIRDFVADRMNSYIERGSPHDYLIRVNRQSVGSDYVLQEGDRVTITPTKIQGAYIRLESVLSVDHRLDYLDDDDCQPIDTDESEADFEEMSPEDLIYLETVL